MDILLCDLVLKKDSSKMILCFEIPSIIYWKIHLGHRRNRTYRFGQMQYNRSSSHGHQSSRNVKIIKAKKGHRMHQIALFFQNFSSGSTDPPNGASRLRRLPLILDMWFNTVYLLLFVPFSYLLVKVFKFQWSDAGFNCHLVPARLHWALLYIFKII